MRAAHAATLALAAALAACTLLPWSSLEPGGPGIDASTEASASDARADGDPSGDAGDAAGESGIPGNVFSDPGFEGSNVGCGAWSGFASAVSISNEAHSGAKSCMVCISGPNNGGLYAEPMVDGAKGQVAQWTGWYKNPADGGAAEMPGTQIDLIDNVGDGGTHTDFGTILVGSNVWKPLSFTSKPAPNAFDQVGLNIVVHSPDGGLACVLVDDMSLVVGN